VFFDFVAGGLLGEGDGLSDNLLTSGSGWVAVGYSAWLWHGDHFEW
jgi:hypothetical protein